MKKRSTINQILFATGLTLAICLGAKLAVSSVGGSGKAAVSAAPQCTTICFRSPEYYLHHANHIPNIPVLIAGENYNNPTSDPAAIYFALRGPGLFSSNPTKLFNQQFVAAQFSLGNDGGGGSASVFTALTGQLSCYGLPTAPVTLSNNVVINSNSTLGDLFAASRDALANNRTADFTPLANILSKLYDPTVVLNYCP